MASVFTTIEPRRAESSTSLEPYTTNTAQIASPRTSAQRSSVRAAPRGSEVSSASSLTCWFLCISQGATSRVATGRLYSETSRTQASVPKPRLRTTTSRVTSSAMAPSSSAAAQADAWRTRRYAFTC